MRHRLLRGFIVHVHPQHILEIEFAIFYFPRNASRQFGLAGAAGSMQSHNGTCPSHPQRLANIFLDLAAVNVRLGIRGRHKADGIVDLRQRRRGLVDHSRPGDNGGLDNISANANTAIARFNGSG